MRFTYTLTMVSIKSAFSQTGRASYQQRQVAGRGKSPFAQQADGRRFKRIGIIDRRLSQGARERPAHSHAKRLDAAHRMVFRQHRCGATDTYDGWYLYVSNRGHNSVAIFRRHPATGLLSARGHAATSGKTPRNFAVHPLGHWLGVANQDSDEPVVFGGDASTGQLTANGARASAGSPTRVRFL